MTLRCLAVALAVAATLGASAGCRSKNRGGPTAPTPVGAQVSTGQTSDPCAPTDSAPPQAVTDPNGPYFHRVAVGLTPDGISVSGFTHVLDHASVPDGVRLADGRVFVYYVNAAENALWVAELAGGLATPIGAVTLNGVARPNGLVDPDALLTGGRVRLFFLGGFGAPSATAPRAMCAAESDDGINFTSLGAALSVTGETWTDPSVAQLPDGRWLMAVSAGSTTVLARSGDGLHFTAGERLTYGGVPELSRLEDGRVRLYVCANGIQSYVSPDGGDTWQFEATVLSGIGLACDPSRVAGTDLFVFKTGY